MTQIVILFFRGGGGPSKVKVKGSEENRAAALYLAIHDLDGKKAFNNNKAVFSNCSSGQNRANLANSSTAFYLLVKEELERLKKGGLDRSCC